MVCRPAAITGELELTRIDWSLGSQGEWKPRAGQINGLTRSPPEMRLAVDKTGSAVSFYRTISAGVRYLQIPPSSCRPA